VVASSASETEESRIFASVKIIWKRLVPTHTRAARKPIFLNFCAAFCNFPSLSISKNAKERKTPTAVNEERINKDLFTVEDKKYIILISY
jgi:hypothetical protein